MKLNFKRRNRRRINNLNIKTMKTNLSQKVVLVIAVLSITVFSCRKDALTPAPVVNNQVTNPASTLQVGTITDQGLMNPDAIGMLTSMVMQDFTVAGPDNEVKGEKADFAVNLYSNQDGLITEGTYTFSNSGSKAPFTFDNVNLYASLPPQSVDKVLLDVVGGTIDVSRLGSNYVVSLKLDLASGDSFTGSFNGKLLYNDSTSK
jgi:hypothetical protein